MPFPALEHWDKTRDGLHQAALDLGAVSLFYSPSQPNYLHHSLQVVPQGIATPELPIGRLILDYKALRVVYTSQRGDTDSVPLAGQTQVSLLAAMLDALLAAGHTPDIQQDEPEEVPLEINAQQAAAYAGVQHTIAEALRAFRATLPGEKTPVVIWPHGFDISFLWFATDKATEEAPHINFGFSPGSPGLDRPYLYTYAWPLPAGYTGLPLPPLNHYHTTGWTGTVLPYDALRAQDDPAAMIRQSVDAIFTAVSPLLR